MSIRRDNALSIKLKNWEKTIVVVHITIYALQEILQVNNKKILDSNVLDLLQVDNVDRRIIFPCGSAHSHIIVIYFFRIFI